MTHYTLQAHRTNIWTVFKILVIKWIVFKYFSDKVDCIQIFWTYSSECLCWVYRFTRYWVAIGPPIIYSLTHELTISAWGMCWRSYINYRLKFFIVYKWMQPYEPVLWGWIRFKVHFVIIRVNVYSESIYSIKF